MERVDGVPTWHVPPPFGDYVALGYGHGTAGIADTILQLWKTTGRSRYRQLVVAAAEGIAGRALRLESVHDGVHWLPLFGRSTRNNIQGWCHGATGIGLFLLHVHEAGLNQDALGLAVSSARVLARTSRSASPTLCNGIAGSVSYLERLADATEDDAWRIEASSMRELILESAFVEDGSIVVPGAESLSARPGLMVGYSGAVLSLWQGGPQRFSLGSPILSALDHVIGRIA
jgi:lantibiotic modifying enzyme